MKDIVEELKELQARTVVQREIAWELAFKEPSGSEARAVALAEHEQFRVDCVTLEASWRVIVGLRGAKW